MSASSEHPAPPGPPRSAVPAQPTVGQLSESQVLGAFLPLARTTGEHVLVGPGDDCAVLAVPAGRAVLTTDTQVVNQDFRSVWPSGRCTSGWDTGHKCAAQNLADVAAMGAEATAAVVSITLPPDTPVRWLQDFAAGFTEAMDLMGAERCALVGGDLGRGSELSVTATVLGTPRGPTVLRSGAAAGGTVVHAGVLGRAAAGLAALEAAPPSGWDGLDPGLRESVINAQLRPCAPLAAGPAAARAGASAMLDVSDGLLRDAGRLARASGVVVDLDPRLLAPDVASLAAAGEAAGVDPWRWVLTGGEDHGLLAVMPPGHRPPAGMRAIGSCAPVGSGTAGRPGVRVAGVPADEWLGYDIGEGWDHFES